MKKLDEQPILETGRLLLRALRMTDAEGIQNHVSDLRIARWTSRIPHPYPEGAAAEWISMLERSEDLVFGMTLRDCDELVGVVGVHPDAHGFSAEIGFWVGIPHWGNGYCTEAVAEILRFCFEELEMMRVHASHFVGNEASGRVQQKVGMRKEGEERWGLFRFGEPKDRVVYGIIRPDWERRSTVSREEPSS